VEFRCVRRGQFTKLLSSYPRPAISDAAFSRIHELSALIPPVKGTAEHNLLKTEMEELIRLVEAVKLVDTSGVVIEGRREVEDLDREKTLDLVEGTNVYGPALLENAARTKDGFYVVDTDRKR